MYEESCDSVSIRRLCGSKCLLGKQVVGRGAFILSNHTSITAFCSNLSFKTLCEAETHFLIWVTQVDLCLINESLLT